MLVSTSSVLWAPTQELVFGRYPLRRGWTQLREIWRWYGVGSDRKYDEAKQRGDPLRSGLLPPRVGRADERRSNRRGSAGSLVKGTKREKPKAGSHWLNVGEQSDLRHAQPGPCG